MKHKFLLILSMAAIAIAVLITLANHQKKDLAQDVSRAGPANTGAEKEKLSATVETPSSDDIFDVESEFAVEGAFYTETDIDIIEKDIPDPVSDETRLVFVATANMSDAELGQFQKLRKGHVIRSSDGVLSVPYLASSDCPDKSTGDDCKTIIKNTKTKTVIYDGGWAKGYKPTGVGEEVVKEGAG